MQASQGTGFSSSIIWLRDLDSKAGWGQETWRVWTMVLEEDAENTLDNKENKWISETPGECYHHTSDDRAETEANMLWARSEGGRFGKFSNVRDGRRKAGKRKTKNEMARCSETYYRAYTSWTGGQGTGQGGLEVGGQGGRQRSITIWRHKVNRVNYKQSCVAI